LITLKTAFIKYPVFSFCDDYLDPTMLTIRIGNFYTIPTDPTISTFFINNDKPKFLAVLPYLPSNYFDYFKSSSSSSSSSKSSFIGGCKVVEASQSWNSLSNLNRSCNSLSLDNDEI